MTVRLLAKELGKQPGSLQKAIRRWKANPAKAYIFHQAGAKPDEAPTGLDEDMSESLAQSIRKEYAPETPTPAPIAPPKAAPQPKTKQEAKPVEQPRAKQIAALPAIFAWVIIAADATSCAWIAYNTYQGNFQAPAAVIFAGVGFAIGFAAFQNIAKYEGYDSSNFAWGFGFFQAMIHLCAMQSFDYFGAGVSFEIGKIVIAIALPIATSGLAVTFKPAKR